MKKILFLLLVTISSYGQTLQNPTFGNATTNTLKIKTPATVTSVNFLSTVEPDGSIAKIAPVNLGFASDANVVHKTGSLSETIDGFKNFISNVGIFNSAPLAPLHVGSRNVNNSSNAQVLISRNFTNSAGVSGHGFSDSSSLSHTADLSYNSFDGRIDVNGTGMNFNHFVSFQHGPNYSFTGQVTDNFGLFTTTAISSGTILHNYGVYLGNPQKSGSGVITENYGIYIADQNGGTSNYSIYSVGGKNFFGGGITAGFQGDNIRLSFDGTNTDDGSLSMSNDGTLTVGNWDNSRTFELLKNGNFRFRGGGKLIINTATDNGVDHLQVNGTASASPAVNNDQLATLGQATGGAKRYKALISQTGTGAPTVKVLENSIGTITFGYNSVGGYTISSSGLFTVDKTFWIIPSGPNGNNTNSINQATASLMYLWSTNVVTGVNVNNGMADTPIMIEVFP